MPTRNSLFRHFVKRKPQPAPIDPADMGTAFGLDASLASGEAAETEDPSSAPKRRQPEQAPMDWLAQRRKRQR